MKVQPYLFFDGRCEEALDFDKRALGAEVLMLMRFNEAPDPPPPDMIAPGSENKVMHASVRIGETEVLASDGRSMGQPVFQGVSLSLAVTSEAEADRVFKALSEGGQIQMPIGKTFWAERFGMLVDRFGIPWMINCDTAVSSAARRSANELAEAR